MKCCSFRVMSEEVFRKGRGNPQEGGPKGIEISEDLNLLLVTSDYQPLPFFDLRQALASRMKVGSPGASVLLNCLKACPCGSRKRYEQCCGRLSTLAVPGPPRIVRFHHGTRHCRAAHPGFRTRGAALPSDARAQERRSQGAAHAWGRPVQPANSFLVNYTLIPVKPRQYLEYEPGWICVAPDIDHAAQFMARLFADPQCRRRISACAAADIAARYRATRQWAKSSGIAWIFWQKEWGDPDVSLGFAWIDTEYAIAS